MSTPSKAGSIGLVMSGLTSATLVGVPSAAWLGPHWGWRAPFVFVGAIAALACLLLRRAVPDLPAAHGASPLRELAALARPRVWLTLGIGAIGFGGMFAVFNDIKPTLAEVTGLRVQLVPLVLALFGLGMVVGNLVGSRLAGISLQHTIAGRPAAVGCAGAGGFPVHRAVSTAGRAQCVFGGHPRGHCAGAANPLDGCGG